MAQYPSHAAGSTIALGDRLTDFSSIDLTVEGRAAGGMGLVVWGHNVFGGSQMTALKLLQPERLAAAASPAARATIEQQFEQEALVWCHLWHHQSVTSAHWLTRLPGLGNVPALVLEYAPNGSLRDSLKTALRERRPIPLRSALAWALHIASALAHIHQPDPPHERPEPLVHCDLKPENVLLDTYGWAQLTDLGLTRAYATLAVETRVPHVTDAGTGEGGAPTDTEHQELVARLREELRAQGLLPGGSAAAGSLAALLPMPDATTLLATRTVRIPSTRAAPAGTNAGDADAQIGEGVAGSPPYMAPEQWRGMTGVVPATDIYAFGVLLYELFAGYATLHPFPRDPRPYFTQDLYTEALKTGYDPALLAWHASHTDLIYRRRTDRVRGERAIGEHRLSDVEAWEAALTSGPCADVLASVGGSARMRAEACLRRIDELAAACMAWEPTARPNAAELVTALASLAENPCGLEPLPIPQPDSATPESEGAFWSNLGVTYSRLGRQSEAINAKRQSVDHDPTDPVKWVNLGASLAAVGEMQRNEARQAEARGHAADAAQLNKVAQAALEEALEMYRQAQARITPKTLASYPTLLASLANNEGAVFSMLERYGEAVAADERALALNPAKLDTRFNQALHYARWSQEPGATREERLARLEAAQSAITAVLALVPDIANGRLVAERIEKALADPAHRFVG